MNKRWTTGKELMEFMDLTQHELYEFTVLGLPVYDQAGRFIINSMKAKTPGTLTRLGAVHVDTGSKMFVDMIGYKKFKIDEVRGFLEERDLMHLIPKPAATEPTQTPEQAKAPPQEKKPFSIPVPDGTTWGDISIRFVNDRRIEIKHPGGMEPWTMEQLGLERKRKRKLIFEMFARKNGTWMPAEINKVKTNIGNLKNHLRDLFRDIPDNDEPLEYINGHGYVCNFKISMADTKENEDLLSSESQIEWKEIMDAKEVWTSDKYD